MVGVKYSHVTIVVDDLDETAEFYREVFGLEELPTPDWDVPVRWFGIGDAQLHLLDDPSLPAEVSHFALHVDEFEPVYEGVRNYDSATVEPFTDRTGAEIVDGHQPVYYLPTGTVQWYIRDPSGNLIEINYPEVDEIHESVVPNIVERQDVEPNDGPHPGDIYGEFGVQPGDD
ncbi:VOC family protein [Halostagnicola sp. A-GB9-2]|uniref:VOC family protein n=1 Tax=Halostagnicola sp. A-GB9-2 TaxID=3048066 RepID=UPI0024BF2092|nr:VOC family protein [Halostagnicola sp. A-GB9-2]MDJ1434393.1 VOC family protein [Halostagnicola sp. A-GB9-2]